MADYAADRNVCITLEIHEGATRTGEISLKLMESVDHPNVGINYDTGNVYYYNEGVDPAEDIKHIAEHVVHVHLKDTKGGKGEGSFVLLARDEWIFPKSLKCCSRWISEDPIAWKSRARKGKTSISRDVWIDSRSPWDYLRQIGLMPPAE